MESADILQKRRSDTNTSKGIFAPCNMLLDDGLQLKIADFGCSSIDGSRSNAGVSARFYPPRLRECFEKPITASDDLFALGSSIRDVLTGVAPFHDISTGQVNILMGLQQFPDLTGLVCFSIFRDCWVQWA